MKTWTIKFTGLTPEQTEADAKVNITESFLIDSETKPTIDEIRETILNNEDIYVSKPLILSIKEVE